MTFEPRLRQDILSTDLITARPTVQVEAGTLFNRIIRNAETFGNRTTTPGTAKEIVEAMELIGHAIEDYETRTNVNADARVHYLYSKPDQPSQLEAITAELVDRDPGVMERTSLRQRKLSSKVRNIKPLLREIKEDPDNPGYKRAILGYFYDNTVRLTCWARTNKTALQRALWLEEVLEEYQWYFTSAGVNRLLYDGRGPNMLEEVQNNRIYGISIDVFIRTEKLRAVSEKELEQVIIRLAVARVVTT